jgi:hypothetical protein
MNALRDRCSMEAKQAYVSAPRGGISEQLRQGDVDLAIRQISQNLSD